MRQKRELESKLGEIRARMAADAAAEARLEAEARVEAEARGKGRR
jgi:hypothetical protein